MVGTCVEIKRRYIGECFNKQITKKQPHSRLRIRWRDTVEKDMRQVNRNATIGWELDRKKWRSLLVAALVYNNPLSY